MKIRIDHEADAIYLPLSDEPIVESELVASGIVLDFGASGEVVGIEVLEVSRRSAMDLSQLLYEIQPKAPAHSVREGDESDHG